ncbi:MAG: hypothetical protein WC779_04370 [Candidatus Omnitrophota bacterium]|jgi:chromosome segregation ATPase
MKDKIVAIVGIVVVVLFVANIATSLYLYKQYNDNINSVNQQNWLNKVKLENLEKSADTFKETVEALSTQLKNYDQSITGIETNVKMGETAAKEITAKMQSIKLDIEDWQKKYSTAISQIAALKEKTESLTAGLDQLKKISGGNVDLGKISVEGEGSVQESDSSTEE